MTDLIPAVSDRWMRIGRSAVIDPESAGAQAAAAQSDSPLDGGPTKLLLVFCSAGYDVAGVLAGVCSVTPDDVIVAGGTSYGQIAGSGPAPTVPDPQPVVVVTALGGLGFTMNSVAVPSASDDRRAAGAAAAAAMAGIEAPHRVMLMFADGLTREQHELVRGAYSVLGLDVPIVGGCSADDLRYAMTYQFHGTGAGVERHVDSIVAVGLGSTAPFGIGIAHGWVKQGEPMVVTRSEGGTVFLLDGEPALDVYLRRIGADRSLLEDTEKFREAAFEIPLGMSRRSGEDIRVVHDVDTEHGALLCLADVPQGALVWTMTTDAEALIRAASESCLMSLNALGDVPARGLLVFDCGARKQKLGPQNLPVEQEAIAAAAAGLPFAGFYTFGEIGRTHGSRGMHHLTVVTLALA